MTLSLSDIETWEQFKTTIIFPLNVLLGDLFVQRWGNIKTN